MVMYESMTIDLDRLDFEAPALQIDHNELVTNGKRGEVKLAFNLLDSGAVVGRGNKRMILSGLREYDKAAMDATIASLNERKLAFLPR
jgi:hypothetical protein